MSSPQPRSAGIEQAVTRHSAQGLDLRNTTMDAKGQDVGLSTYPSSSSDVGSVNFSISTDISADTTDEYRSRPSTLSTNLAHNLASESSAYYPSSDAGSVEFSATDMTDEYISRPSTLSTSLAYNFASETSTSTYHSSSDAGSMDFSTINITDEFRPSTGQACNPAPGSPTYYSSSSDTGSMDFSATKFFTTDVTTTMGPNSLASSARIYSSPSDVRSIVTSVDHPNIMVSSCFSTGGHSNCQFNGRVQVRVHLGSGRKLERLEANWKHCGTVNNLNFYSMRLGSTSWQARFRLPTISPPTLAAAELCSSSACHQKVAYLPQVDRVSDIAKHIKGNKEKLVAYECHAVLLWNVQAHNCQVNQPDQWAKTAKECYSNELTAHGESIKTLERLKKQLTTQKAIAVEDADVSAAVASINLTGNASRDLRYDDGSSIPLLRKYRGAAPVLTDKAQDGERLFFRYGSAEHQAIIREELEYFSIPPRNASARAGDLKMDSNGVGKEQLGMGPVFDPAKARHFDSSWNWVRQDALMMFYDIIFGRLTTVDREITARCIHLLNRADPEMLAFMQYNIDHCDPSKGDTYKLAKEFGQQLIDNTRQVLGQPPVYKDVTFPTAPHTEVTSKGDIVYSEVMRENVRSDTVSGSVNIQKVQDDVLKLWTIVKAQPEISQDQKNRIKSLYEGVVRSLRAKGPEPRPARTPRSRRSSSQFLRPQVSGITSVSADKVPLLHLKRKVGTTWEYSSNLTSVYLDILHEIATAGTTFKDKNALLTGVGKGSIGVEVVKGLLSGGAHVIITTSRYNRSTVEYYQSIFQMCGSRGSALTVVPFNQGSKQDVEALVDYIYSSLGMDLDFILPFASIPENGREIDGIDDKSELAHRTTYYVILPLSPNHGVFGNDGLYSESKIALETLFQRWASESWGEYLCLAGAVIGWTRGTTLMGPTNIVAEGLETYGVRTFSAKEMAFNILGLMHPLLFSITQVEPIWADLNGGMDRLPDIADVTGRIRSALNKKGDLRRAIARDNAADFKVLNGVDAERLIQTVDVLPRANFRFNFPELESQESLVDVTKLRGMLDLDKVMVITGSAEVGPWGSPVLVGRWKLEGNLRLKDGSLYVGWVDSKSGEPVDDKDVRGRYEKDILEHAGIRLIEPELFRGYDPNKKVFNQEVELIHDLEPIEVTAEEASKFKLQHGDKCDIWAGEGGQWFFKLKKGACVFVPKAFSFSRKVASQIPTGWHAGRYGIPDDIIALTDPVTLWNLVCTAEALNMSGITDPGRNVAWCSGMGGQVSLAKMFIDRRDEKDVQNDILQETGPVKIPVGACATALQALEIACDTVLAGKAKVMIAGGYDDISEEGSYEFANMKATSNADSEFVMGREPTEMSRPTASTRSGFMEAQGSAVHIVMSAKTALELECPIRSIILYLYINAGRSIPAPGHGSLTIAREVPSKQPLPLLNLAYRERQLSFRRTQVSQWLAHEQQQLRDEIETQKASGQTVDEEYYASKVAAIEHEASRQEKEAVGYGMLEGSDPHIAPLRRTLAVWGLTVDDINVLSIHGTSTKANEENETHIWNTVFTCLGRTAGNIVPVMAQKSLLGHSKGGSAAWQVSGLMNSLHTGIVPGNRNADHLMFPSKTIHTDGIRAGIMSSFGFGQVGGVLLMVHPRKERRAVRAKLSYKAMSEMMIKNNLVQIKERPPYPAELEDKVLLNSMARTMPDPKSGSYAYNKKYEVPIAIDTANFKTVSDVLAKDALSKSAACTDEFVGVGVDQGMFAKAKTKATEKGVSKVLISLSHSEGFWALEPSRCCISSIALVLLKPGIVHHAGGGDTKPVEVDYQQMATAQKLLLFWRKPARKCWWDGLDIELPPDGEDEGQLRFWLYPCPYSHIHAYIVSPYSQVDTTPRNNSMVPRIFPEKRGFESLYE
ncbi:hypothetical protein BDP27DRAFT_1368514 [Rhodocollybia butyracea]|uniref:beta-ketoacyl-[acyl-carrier-protein] synthase I n=1 Tax=Rhodocollybia butyracea TaxID=206335 RepID=A0A9P5PHL4_9AGAR|nr:hypothetical protein BDP27DRAFT_1368514 [Rhodocollybia butyracea]